MRPVVFIVLYLVVALVAMPFFARIEHAKRIQKDPVVLLDPEDPRSKSARIETMVTGILYGAFWPVALVGTLVYALFNGISFGVPKEMKREMALREARQIIEDYEKEQEGKNK